VGDKPFMNEVNRTRKEEPENDKCGVNVTSVSARRGGGMLNLFTAATLGAEFPFPVPVSEDAGPSPTLGIYFVLGNHKSTI
jgi:hypothetical protein